MSKLTTNLAKVGVRIAADPQKAAQAAAGLVAAAPVLVPVAAAGVAVYGVVKLVKKTRVAKD